MHDDAVEVDDRPDGVEPARTPQGNLAIEVGGDLGNERGGDLDAVKFLDDILDVAAGQALGVQGQDLVVEAAQAALVLADELRLEGAVAVARDVEADLAEFALDGFLGVALRRWWGASGVGASAAGSSSAGRSFRP
jgi:hypothetical protein